MLVMRGAHFARKLLAHEHAAEFASPPRCGACNGTKVDLRRGTHQRAGESGWYWRCYSPDCPRRSAKGSGGAWIQPIAFRR